MTAVAVFGNIFEGEKSLNSNFLTWTGLRHAVPLNLRTHPHSFTVTLDLENFKCRNYSLLIKFKYEKPKKWAKIKEEFDLEDNCISEAFSLPMRVCSEPYLRSFQYKVLRTLFFLPMKSFLKEVIYLSPNCSFCQDTKETRNHVLFT